MSASDRYYTVAAVAERLGINADTVRRAIRAQKLRGARFGKRGGYRIHEADLTAWIASLQERPEKETGYNAQEQ